MSVTATALVGLVIWSVVLAAILVTVRVTSAMGGGKALNGFSPDGTDLGDFGLRVTRAHANSLENLALPVGLLLLAIATGNEAVTNATAMLYLGCRVGQSVVHMISTAIPFVMVRATLFTVQLVLLVMWGIKLAGM